MLKRNLALSLCLSIFSILVFATQISGQIVINEIYPGGGNSGATYHADFIELKNNGGTAVNLAGYTLWYASATGNFNSSVSLSGTIPAMGFFLVQTTSPGGTGVALPSPDQTAASPNMSASNGNVLLSDPTFALASGFACPPGGTTGVLDRVAYGTGTCPETAAASPTGSNANSVQRATPGVDSDNNSADFVSAAATPQASGTTSANAGIFGRVVNQKGRGLRFVTVMITGNGLPEPLYVTTNIFGRYQFDDLPVGESYVLQVFSKRYVFDQTSLILHLDENATGINFIGTER